MPLPYTTFINLNISSDIAHGVRFSGKLRFLEIEDAITLDFDETWEDFVIILVGVDCDRNRDKIRSTVEWPFEELSSLNEI
jgi:hypothetical protein